MYLKDYFPNAYLQNSILSNNYSSLRSELESKSKNRRYHIASNKLISKLLKKNTSPTYRYRKFSVLTLISNFIAKSIDSADERFLPNFHCLTSIVTQP